jgi:hypothetical protein
MEHDARSKHQHVPAAVAKSCFTALSAVVVANAECRISRSPNDKGVKASQGPALDIP